MTDIVEVLRDYAQAEDLSSLERENLRAAADEIERLRAELDALRRNSSYCPTPLSVPELTKEMLDRIEARAERSFRRHKSSIRGQQIIPQDDFDWHIIHATREELAAAPKPHWPVPSAPAVPQWQPIETAPKLAGGRVLILKDCGPGTLSSMSIAFWLDDDRWHLTESTRTAESYGYRVTHWMPLPAAPSPTEKKES